MDTLASYHEQRELYDKRQALALEIEEIALINDYLKRYLDSLNARAKALEEELARMVERCEAIIREARNKPMKSDTAP